MHSTISLIDSDAVRLSPALRAVEVFVQHVKESSMPYFCLRDDAAFEVLTGVRMEKGFHGYAVEADTPQAIIPKIRAVFGGQFVKPLRLDGGNWHVAPVRDQASLTDLAFVYHPSTENPLVSITLHTEGGLFDLLKPQLTDYSVLEDTWSIITFRPSHLNFRIYNPTLILVDLLYRLQLSGPSIRGSEHEIHLILILLEKGFKPECLGLGKGKLTHFSIEATWKILKMMNHEYVERADHNAMYLCEDRVSISIAVEMSSHRKHSKLEGSQNVGEIASCLGVLHDIFQEGHADNTSLHRGEAGGHRQRSRAARQPSPPRFPPLTSYEGWSSILDGHLHKASVSPHVVQSRR